MIRHVVFFSAAEGQDPEVIREGLMMLARIPQARHFEVGRNLRADQIGADAPDLVVYAEFDDEAALAAYKADPIYEQCIALVRPMREMRIAADFTAG